MGTPASYVLFRPEEKHGFSVEDDIVPPTVCRDGEMDYAIIAFQPVAGNAQLQGHAAIPTGCSDQGILLEHGNDAHGIPDTISKARVGGEIYNKRGWYCRKRIGHKYLVTTGLKHENPPSREALECSQLLFRWD